MGYGVLNVVPSLVPKMLLWFLLTFDLSPQSVALGLCASLISSALFRDLYKPTARRFFEARRWVWFLFFIPRFAFECFRSNLDVAYRVLHPSMPIYPGIVRVPTDMKSDFGLTALSSAITLTPGTLTIDVDKKEGCIYVHYIDIETLNHEELAQQITGKFEGRLKAVFE